MSLTLREMEREILCDKKLLAILLPTDGIIRILGKQKVQKSQPQLLSPRETSDHRNYVAKSIQTITQLPQHESLVLLFSLASKGIVSVTVSIVLLFEILDAFSRFSSQDFVVG